MTVKQLSDGNTDGALLGQSATDKVAFYGGTPIAKQTATLAAALADDTTTPANIAAAVDELHTALVNLGLIS